MKRPAASMALPNAEANVQPMKRIRIADGIGGQQLTVQSYKMPADGCYHTVAMAHDGGNYLNRNPLMYIKLNNENLSGWIAGEVSPGLNVIRGQFTTKPLLLGAKVVALPDDGMECHTNMGQSYCGFQSATLSSLTPCQTFAAVPINSDVGSDSDSVDAKLPAHDIPVLEGDILCTFKIAPFNRLQKKPDVYRHLARLLSEDQVRAAGSLLGCQEDDVDPTELVYAIGRELGYDAF
jgi:hypothetical protein